MGSFYFKKFAIRHTDSAMKVNTDGVLLPAWVSISKSNSKKQRVLDIGTGTGVISLIIAQRLDELHNPNFEICAIDIDADAAKEANFNFANSSWSQNLKSEHISLQDFLTRFKSDSEHECEVANQKFSLIISNPPFFTNSLQAPSQRRTDARHNNALPFSDLIKGAFDLLGDDGVFAVILPADVGDQFIEFASARGLHPQRLCRLKTLAEKVEKRYMIEFSKNKKASFSEETLVMQLSGGKYYTPEYCQLVEKFYLKDFPQTTSGN